MALCVLCVLGKDTNEAKDMMHAAEARTGEDRGSKGKECYVCVCVWIRRCYGGLLVSCVV